MDEVVFDSVQEGDEIGERQSFDADLEFHSSTLKWMGSDEEHVVVAAGFDCCHYNLQQQFECHDTSG